MVIILMLRISCMLICCELAPGDESPLPRSSFGNIYRISMTGPFTISNTSLDNDPCYGMVRHIREAMSKIDNEYVKRLQEGDEHLSSIKKNADSFTREHLVTYNFTSLCRYPLYDNDFGWGRPTWVGLPALTFKNLIVFLDTKEAGGGGISSPTSTLTRQQARFSQVTKYHTQSRPSLGCERPIQTKPMKILWSGSVSLRLLLKVLKK
ncbi:vinorine synthase-like [Pyrus ussuriensis x Pyrus communis]|uniref:Vinorine synthase-like n=1 Tax=Pyrus ussuriensis x Pyrus communis TaxID=2448454 RepID=A0A5N5FKY1_9ROSA|nr:vinorine synthase-like [Pyrus ussuriensis x Pyrus communis]